MKKNILLLFILLSYFLNGQTITTQEIDNNINVAKDLSQSNPIKSLELAEKTYKESTKIDYRLGILESGNILMTKYFDNGNFKKVIELSKIIEKLSTEEKDNEILSNTYRLRASSYTELGFNDESFKEFKKAMHIADRIKSKNYNYYQKSLVYIGLANHAAHINAPIDSVIYYQRKSLETITKVDNSSDYSVKKDHTLALTYINLGMTSNASQKTKQAEEYFSKALAICKKDNRNKNLEVTVLNEFAWLYYDQKKYNESKNYAEQAEVLEKQVKAPYIRRDIYEVLFKSYVELSEKDTSKKYMHLYTKLNDSLVNAEKKTINTPVKHIVDKQSEVHESGLKKILTIIFVLIVCALIILYFLWRRNQQKLHLKYEKIIENLKNTQNTIDDDNSSKNPTLCNDNKSINIIDATVQSILQKLELFEDGQQFLKQDLSLTSLAHDLNTNTRSLSEIIKKFKNKNYNSYINNLRINYMVNLLASDPNYREYKISYLAEISGFSSREVFTITFKKETGVNPSYFINNLKKDYDETKVSK